MKGHADHRPLSCGHAGATEGFDDYPGYYGKCNADLDLDLHDAHLEYLRMFEQDKDEYNGMLELRRLKKEGLFRSVKKTCKHIWFRGRVYTIKDPVIIY